ncbi:MAG: hypothetical protein A2Y07_06895 [Planctomycetes bacterium GWF2_50_10]|nr:MAG: hypothetical protein A2Y07_06895 [Planctomycetes bacterium GWF2_50_10]
MTTIIFDLESSRLFKDDAGVDKALVVFTILERPELGRLSITSNTLVPTGTELRTAITAKLAKIDQIAQKNTGLRNLLVTKQNLVL